MGRRGNSPVALVTGASRGVGRGIVLGLEEAGFLVFATGRSIESADLPGTVVRLSCDHLDDSQTAAAFARVHGQTGRLDVLVNNAWGGYERMVEDGVFTWPEPFWQQPMDRWTAMMDVGARSALVCSAHAAGLMMPRKNGLVVNISFWAAQQHVGNVIYGMAKAATDKFTADAAVELAPYNISVISLYPGLVRTEAVLEAAAGGAFELSNSESPQFIGRVVAGLARERDVIRRSGKVVVAAQAAAELQIVDVDGRQPVALNFNPAASPTATAGS